MSNLKDKILQNNPIYIIRDTNLLLYIVIYYFKMYNWKCEYTLLKKYEDTMEINIHI